MVRISCQLALTLTAKDVVEVLGLDVAERRQRAEDAGIADHHVEPAVALMERQRQPRDAIHVLHVERHQCRRAAGGLDPVVEFFQAADRARHRDDMGAGFGELKASAAPMPREAPVTRATRSVLRPGIQKTSISAKPVFRRIWVT